MAHRVLFFLQPVRLCSKSASKSRRRGCTGVRRMTGNRDQMGFMFDHDDVTQELNSKRLKKAA